MEKIKSSNSELHTEACLQLRIIENTENIPLYPLKGICTRKSAENGINLLSFALNYNIVHM